MISAADGGVFYERCPAQHDSDQERQLDEHLDYNESQPYRIQNHV